MTLVYRPSCTPFYPLGALCPQGYTAALHCARIPLFTQVVAQKGAGASTRETVQRSHTLIITSCQDTDPVLIPTPGGSMLHGRHRMPAYGKTAFEMNYLNK